MPLFKRKDPNLIPPVPDLPTGPASTRSRSPYQSNASTYNASRDGDPYNYPSSATLTSPPPVPSDHDLRDKYSRNRGIGDVYSRGNAELDRDRIELFSGYDPKKVGSGRFFDGPQAGPEPTPGEENEEDVEGIKKQTRFVKQESVNSTRNAIRLAREAEDTARNTVLRLGDQSGRMLNAVIHIND